MKQLVQRPSTTSVLTLQTQSKTIGIGTEYNLSPHFTNAI